MKYIDIHTHPFLEYFNDPVGTCKQWYDEGATTMFIVGTNEENSKEVINTASKLDYVYPIIGIHPNECSGASDGAKLEKIITDDVIAIGEIGLDYHFTDTPSPETQLQSLQSQVEVARKHNIPVMLHIRDAMGDAIRFVTNPKNKDLTFIFHSFAGDCEDVKTLLNYDNVYFSISGIVTFKNGKITQAAVREIPIDRIFTETDSPYLAPTPMRGKENKSPYVAYTTKYIASLKGVSEAALVNQIAKNIKKVFGVKCK